MSVIISRDELLGMLRSGEPFKLVDVLPAEPYRQEHIVRAISVPLAELEKKAPLLLDKKETIVVYCGSFECDASAAAARKLERLGYEHVLVYKGGLKDYKEAGLALEGDAVPDEPSDVVESCD